MQFSYDIALSLIQSSETFPVDFDSGWKWLGWKKKQDAKSVLFNNFEEEIVFLRKGVKSSTGGRPGEWILLTIDCFKSLAMMAGTSKGKEVRSYFLKCERIAKQAVEIIPAQAQEIERMKLELELIKAKQHYQDTAQAILASTSPAMLAYLRGDALPPVSIQYRDRFIDATTGLQIDSQSGRSLTQLIADAGLNPKSTSERNIVKKILRRHGWNYDTGSGWSTTSYLREYKVLSDEVYEEALKTILAELTTETAQQNLFVYQFQHGASLSRVQKSE